MTADELAGETATVRLTARELEVILDGLKALPHLWDQPDQRANAELVAKLFRAQDDLLPTTTV